jgi:metalloproteinase inhibitor 2
MIAALSKAAAAAACFVMLAAVPAKACQCYPWSKPDIVARADAVIEGTVAVVTRIPNGQSQATIDVTRQEKGAPVSSIVVVTPGSPATCGVDFRIAQRVYFAAVRDGPIWRTNLCMALALRPAPFVPNR